jgi:hypothetical protein
MIIYYWAVEVHTSTEPPHFENNIKVFRHGMVRLSQKYACHHERPASPARRERSDLYFELKTKDCPPSKVHFVRRTGFGKKRLAMTILGF